MADNLKVLILEDQRFVAEDLADRLSEFEIVGPFASGEEVKSSEVLPDIAVLDIEIKGEMDGVQVAEWLNEKKNIPVIFLTKISDDSDIYQRIQALTCPVFYIAKPVSGNELKVNINNAINTLKTAFSPLNARTENFSMVDGKVLLRGTTSSHLVGIDSEIYYVQADGDCSKVFITTLEHPIVVAIHLKEFLVRMSEFSNSLVRINRFTAVNILKIKTVVNSRHNLSKNKTVFLEGIAEGFQLSGVYKSNLLDRFHSV